MNSMQSDTSKRIEGITPNGGVYSVIYFRDSEGKPCNEANATACEIVEYDAANNPIYRTYGCISH